MHFKICALRYDVVFCSTLIVFWLVISCHSNSYASEDPKLQESYKFADDLKYNVESDNVSNYYRQESAEHHSSPEYLLFEPLFADPKFPRFSLSYQNVNDSMSLEHAGYVSFGERWPLVEWHPGSDSAIQLGISAVIRSLFDLDTPSKDLVNADYWIDVPLMYRNGNLSTLTRVFHQSSHLGDEYILKHPECRRINWSYEGASHLFSYDLPYGLRAYGGGGYVFRKSKDIIKPWIGQGGAQYKSQKAYFSGSITPVAAFDVQVGQDMDYDPRYSALIGFEVSKYNILGSFPQIHLEYYHGGLVAGQLCEEEVESIGISINFYTY